MIPFIVFEPLTPRFGVPLLLLFVLFIGYRVVSFTVFGEVACPPDASNPLPVRPGNG